MLAHGSHKSFDNVISIFAHNHTNGSIAFCTGQVFCKPGRLYQHIRITAGAYGLAMFVCLVQKLHCIIFQFQGGGTCCSAGCVDACK